MILICPYSECRGTLKRILNTKMYRCIRCKNWIRDEGKIEEEDG